VLLSYGDEYEVLGFRDLIEVKVVGEAELDIKLRNPEYDLARTIKKVLFGFQGGGSIFSNIADPVEFVGYISSDDKLPPALAEYRAVLTETLESLRGESDGKFSIEIVDPDAGDGAVALEIEAQYGFQPMAASLFDSNVFYFYLTLRDEQTLIQVPLPEALSLDASRRGIQEGLKRFASGLMKTVALVLPEAPPAYMGMGQPPQGNQFEQLKDFLTSDFNIETTTLSDGLVPESADLLMVVDPENLDERQLFAIDQFLMKGGTVVLAAAPFTTTVSQQSLFATPRTTGLEDWLAHHGIEIAAQLVMDPQNAAFPAPVTRQVGGFSFQDLVMLDYPYFIDVRGAGLNADSALTSGLPQVTMGWASPIALDAEKQQGRTTTILLQSSPGSWLSQDTNVMPKVNDLGLSGFAPEGELASQTLAVLVEGRFDSFFTGQPSPLLELPEEPIEEPDVEGSEADETIEDTLGVVTSVIDRSTDSARLFVFASNGFLADQFLRMVGSAEGVVYSNTVQMMANVVDWSLEDQSLLGIRSRGHFNRTLPPMDNAEQALWEYLNYLLAVLGIAAVFLVYRRRMASTRRIYAGWLEGDAS
jgi:ABC-2 type transport system permease protein